MAEPPVGVQAIHDDGPGNLPPTRVVIHSTCPNMGYPAASAPGDAQATAVYFQNPNAGGSAHYVVDDATEVHCVADSHIAWHAPPNDRSIGIEICSEGGDYARDYSRAEWLSPAVWPAVLLAAARTAELCKRFGIPAVRVNATDLLNGAHGICGHVDVSQAWHQSTHTDPGPHFPWPEFVAAINGSNGGSAVPPIRKDDAMEIDLRVKPDGTFRRLIQAEAGVTSAAFARAFVTFGAAYLTADVSAVFDIVALDDAGSAMGPKTEWHGTVTNNRRHYLELPSGVVQVTISGAVPVGGEVSAALVTTPK